VFSRGLRVISGGVRVSFSVWNAFGHSTSKHDIFVYASKANSGANIIYLEWLRHNQKSISQSHHSFVSMSLRHSGQITRGSQQPSKQTSFGLTTADSFICLNAILFCEKYYLYFPVSLSSTAPLLPFRCMSALDSDKSLQYCGAPHRNIFQKITTVTTKRQTALAFVYRKSGPNVYWAIPSSNCIRVIGVSTCFQHMVQISIKLLRFCKK